MPGNPVCSSELACGSSKRLRWVSLVCPRRGSGLVGRFVDFGCPGKGGGDRRCVLKIPDGAFICSVAVCLLCYQLNLGLFGSIEQWLKK